MKQKDPAIEVVFHVKNSAISHVLLGLSNSGFVYRIEGEKNELLANEIKKWVTSYLNRTPLAVSLPLGEAPLPPFTIKVLNQMKKIPFGRTISYGELAELCSNPQGARATGSACGRNPWPLIVPCHRVLAAKHALGGFSCGLEIKRRLLDFEGISYR